MKIVVIGGTGLIGTKVSNKLRQLGHQVIAASPGTGVNTLTGEGLAAALEGADVIADLANSPSFEDQAVMDFFKTAGKNLLSAALNAGVKHHIALSVVGTERLQESGYFRAKSAQEELIRNSNIPYTILHSTQFFEFLSGIVASAHNDGAIKLSQAGIQPISSDDVAEYTVQAIIGDPINGIQEIAGPDRFGLAGLVSIYLQKTGDPREVEIDNNAKYFGASLQDDTLIPSLSAKFGKISFDQWIATQTTGRVTA